PRLRVPGLGVLDKLLYLLGTARAKLYSDKQIEALDNISIADWLRAQRQPPAVVEWFWQPFIVGVCNGRLAEVSARHALSVLRESLLKSPEASAICLLRRPLSAVFDRLAREVLQRAGAAVRTGANVSAVVPGAPVTVRTADGQTHAFDRVVLALPAK